MWQKLQNEIKSVIKAAGKSKQFDGSKVENRMRTVMRTVHEMQSVK